MTNAEYTAWIRKARSDAGYWTLDPIHNGVDRSDLLAYAGQPEDPSTGVYLSISAEGEIRTGRYTDAVPHIGEAEFMPTKLVKLSNKYMAIEYTVDTLRLGFLIDLLAGSAHPRIPTS